MSALDRFIEDAATRLQLGYRSRPVVEALSAWVQSHPQGLDGLEHQFQQRGLGTRFRSWRRNDDAPLPISASELERVTGGDTLQTLARRALLPPGMFRVIACELLPGLIGLAAAGHAPPPRRPLKPPATASGASDALPLARMHGGILRGMAWVLATLALAGAAAWLHLALRTPHWTAPATTVDSAPQLSLQQHGGRVLVQGQLPGEPERRRVWNALVLLHGKRNVHGTIALSRTARAPRWLDRLVNRLPQLQGDGLQLSFDGDQLQVDTSAMPEDQRLALSQLLRRDFADLRTTGLWGPGLAALAQLPADAGTDVLIPALNQTSLKFHPGSAVLRGDSADTLAAVASALKAAPAGTRLQVGAHTDSNGHPASNLHLSQQRAEAVVHALQAQGVPAAMLVPVGHGQDQPVADNRSEQGRASNRRVAYAEIDPSAGAGAGAR